MTTNGYEEYKKELDKYSANIPANPANSKVWVFCIQKSKWVNCGCFNDEIQATDYAITHLNQYHWELFRANTADINTVQREWKRHILDRTSNLEEATSLISRKPAEEKRKKDKDEDFWK